ncbi:MAG: Tm-1-like ATP-binding domain-containing protein [Gemmatimonadaceae bacterium]
MSGTVLLVGTFDTKAEEYAFVRAAILERGSAVLTMDIGVLDTGRDAPFPVDISSDVVALAGGARLADLRTNADRGGAVAAMLAGARALVRELFAARRFDGVLGLGGGGGTTMITAAMRELPVGVPKLMVSTMASGNTAPYVDVKDITMMYSVVDIAGLNPISARILRNAAGAICGMLDAGGGADTAPRRPTIAATMFGVTTPCVTAARKRLEGAGYDVVVFHATGSGGRAMEGLIDDGFFGGVLDVTTTEWCDEVVGGVLSAGPDRLTAAGRKGIPQVVSVGALDMVNFGGAETVPERFRDRTLYRHNATVTLMRTSPGECREIGRRIMLQLSGAKGPVLFMLPLRGVSMLDADGQPFHDPDADQALFQSLRDHAPPNVTIHEIDAHINDPAFADALADTMLAELRRKPASTAS